ncbi:hypothetical protein WA026_021930 [Henosepilachna vigintioctopunctata]|uniref:Uncharacterized protein n=1 Tax=Henosepilachna vigintioctopunctata TaxID=420089 RepID=A0AAW1VG26_9CUCU
MKPSTINEPPLRLYKLRKVPGESPSDLVLVRLPLTIKDKYYAQDDGLPWASVLLSVVANTYMEEDEKQVMHTSVVKPKLWLRYGDTVLSQTPSFGTEH